MKVLAIDDNQDNLITMKALIMEAFPAAVILTAQSGKKGLELASAEDPDVILLDVLMPEMDGFEVCEKLKADKKLSEIPVVFVTALKGDRESRIRALGVGAEAFLAKPIDESELTAQIRAMVKIKAASIEKREENTRLASLVEAQTLDLKNAHLATLKLLEELKIENAARRSSENALIETHAILQAAMDQSSAGIAIADAPDGRLRYVNDAGLLIRGSDRQTVVDGIGVDQYAASWQLLDLDGRQLNKEEVPLARAIMFGEKSNRKFIIRRTGGEDRFVSANASPIRDKADKVVAALVVFTDITEHRKLEEQLRHSQRMESIGTLAGGIAHDFNNILSIIIGYGEIFLMKMSADDNNRQYVTHILEGAERAARLTQQLLLFSRKQVADKEPVDINDLITKVQKFLVRVIGDDISCQTSLCGDKLQVLADPYQLEQVLVNLATNARDVMPNGGNFLLSTESVTIHEDFVTALGFGRPGNYALITVTDTGTGMDEETRQQIFEPFFTTKEVGKGTGLGLAVTYGIIKQHDGFISVYSEPDIGTTFRIYLPVILSEHVEKNRDKLTEAVAGGTETILLAEDDEMLRNMMATILCDAGYTVIEAVDGVDAVNKFSGNSAYVDMLMLDLLMPGKNGKEVFDEIRKLRPGIKTLFTSGCAPEIIRHKVVVEEGIRMIAKPMAPQELLREIRSVLDDMPA